MNKSKRKHIKYDKLKELSALSAKGVPTARLIRDHSLDVSVPHLAKLIRCFNAYKALPVTSDKALELHDSLFPDWVDDTGSDIQIQPSNWKYNGLFPFGSWSERQ